MSFGKTFINELKTIFSDFAIVLTIIGGVLLYAFLYPQPYTKQSVSELKMGVVDMDKSDISRDIIFNLNSTPQANIIAYFDSVKDAKEAIKQNSIKGLLVIPKHFKRDILLGRMPSVSVMADSSYFLIFGGILEASMKTILQESAKVSISWLVKDGKDMRVAIKEFMPYKIKTVNLFNKDESYTQYVVPAVFVLILQQTMLIGLGILGGGVRERAYEGCDYDAKPLHVILSRYIIFGALFFVHMLFYFGFSFEFFGITHLANTTSMLCFGVLFLFASLSFGVFLGTLFTSREVATPTVLFSSLPLVFSVGFVWPKEAIPKIIIYLSNLAPSTPAINGFLKLNQMGASLDMLTNEVLMLVLQIVCYTFFAYMLMAKQRNKYQ